MNWNITRNWYNEFKFIDNYYRIEEPLKLIF